MILGIDASTIRGGGGGVTHLIELLRSSTPNDYGFKQVIVWGGLETLSRLEKRPWLIKIHEPLLDRSLPYRFFWQRFALDAEFRRAGCDLLLVLGGSYTGSSRPFVAVSQNLLPFDLPESFRYVGSWVFLRLMLLRWLQMCTFRDANGVIFLTKYARDVVLKTMKTLTTKTTIIPHGINPRFFLSPRPQRNLSAASDKDPLRLLYVSIIDVYKHQWHVVAAVSKLKKEGLPVQLDLVGPAYPPALRRLNRSLHRFNPQRDFIRYQGPVSYTDLAAWYHKADLFIFASSCETFGQILTEAMAAGLPIACSDQSSMQETLGDAGIYFNPEKPSEIADAVRSLIVSPALRAEKAAAAYRLAMSFTWQSSAEQTFEFLAQNTAT